MIDIRKAVVSDLDMIMKVEEEGFPSEIRESRKVFLDRLNEFPEGVFMLLSDGDVSGYFCCELWEKVPENTNDFFVGHDISKVHSKNGKVLYVSSWAILKKFRGTGYGKKYFEKCIDSVKKSYPAVSKLFLVVNENWAGPRKIYSDYGFNECGEIKGFFPDGSGIMMEK